MQSFTRIRVKCQLGSWKKKFKNVLNFHETQNVWTMEKRLGKTRIMEGSQQLQLSS